MNVSRRRKAKIRFASRIMEETRGRRGWPPREFAGTTLPRLR